MKPPLYAIRKIFVTNSYFMYNRGVVEKTSEIILLYWAIVEKQDTRIITKLIRMVTGLIKVISTNELNLRWILQLFSNHCRAIR